MSKKVYNVCFGQTNPNNPEKRFWVTCGAMFASTSDTGEMKYSLKLNQLPLSNEFDGFFSIFEQDAKSVSAPAKPSQDPEF